MIFEEDEYCYYNLFPITSFTIYVSRGIVKDSFRLVRNCGKNLIIILGRFNSHNPVSNKISDLILNELDKIVTMERLTVPSLINNRLKNSLKVLEPFGLNEGIPFLDIGICRLDLNNKNLLFSSNNFALVVVCNTDHFIYPPISGIYEKYSWNDRSIVHFVPWDVDSTYYLIPNDFINTIAIDNIISILYCIQHLPMDQQKVLIVNEYYQACINTPPNKDFVLLGFKINKTEYDNKVA